MTKRHAIVCVASTFALLLTACPSSPPSDGNGSGSGTGTGQDAGDAVTSPDMGGGGDGGEKFDTGFEPDTRTPEPDVADTGGMDGGDGGDTGMMVPPTDLYYFTSGGGVLSSSGYQLRISLGAPSPRGTASSSNYKIRIAPVSP